MCFPSEPEHLEIGRKLNDILRLASEEEIDVYSSIPAFREAIAPFLGSHRRIVSRRLWDAGDFHIAIMNKYDQRTFFLTTTGHMGTAHQTVEENDIVVLFAGCDLPATGLLPSEIRHGV